MLMRVLAAERGVATPTLSKADHHSKSKLVAPASIEFVRRTGEKRYRGLPQETPASEPWRRAANQGRPVRGLSHPKIMSWAERRLRGNLCR